MKSFIFVIAAITSLIMISSCGNSIYTEREKDLFVNPIFGHEVNVDSIITLGDLVVYFDKVYCEEQSQGQWPIIFFDLKEKRIVNPTTDPNILAIGIEPAPCPDMMFQYDYSRILEVVKDGYNLEVEEDRVELDSLHLYVSKQYLNFNADPKYSSDPINNGIWLISTKSDKLSDLSPFIAQLIEGYVQMANEYSETQYKKPLEDLDDVDFHELKNTLSFHLSFKFSDEPLQIKVGY